jgi:hypothetical protein
MKMSKVSFISAAILAVLTLPAHAGAKGSVRATSAVVATPQYDNAPDVLVSGLRVGSNIRGKTGTKSGYAGSALGLLFAVSRLYAAEEAVRRSPGSKAAYAAYKAEQQNMGRSFIGAIPVVGSVVSFAEAAQDGDGFGMACAVVGGAGFFTGVGIVAGANAACDVKYFLETVSGESMSAYSSQGGYSRSNSAFRNTVFDGASKP